MNSKIVIIIVGVAIIIVLLVFSLVDYRNEIWNARKRISVAKKIEWSEGTIEYETGGQGLPILIVHGGGGGFDQGRLLAKNVLGDDLLWIAPSRFGYLGSDLPQNADISLQAKAYEALLDELGIEKVAVLALSAGGPSAIHFVLSKQERSTALVMLSAISLTIPEYDKGGHGVFIFERESISQYISSFIRESFASYSSSQ